MKSNEKGIINMINMSSKKAYSTAQLISVLQYGNHWQRMYINKTLNCILGSTSVSKSH